jgi:hypothetical protein
MIDALASLVMDQTLNIHGITLTSSPTGCKKGIFMWKLSSNVRSRLRIELTRIKNSTTTKDSFLYRLVMQFKISYLALRMTTETAINIHLCVMRIEFFIRVSSILNLDLTLLDNFHMKIPFLHPVGELVNVIPLKLYDRNI